MTFISKVDLGFFRSYKSTQQINLAAPNGQAGSGLTVVVGPNNAGKTTLIEMLLFNPQFKRISESEKILGKEPFITFTLDNGNKMNITTVKSNSSQLIGGNPKIEVVPSRRHWQSRDGVRQPISSTLQTTIHHDIRSGGSISVASILKEIEKDQTRMLEFTNKLQKIFPNFKTWFVGYESDTDFIGYQTEDGAKHRTDFMGDGVGSVFRILAHLLEGQTKILIIDEPELSLQPEAQKKLLYEIAEIAKTKQVILCTHSTYFINFKHFKNGAAFVRVNKHNDKESTIHQLGNYNKYNNLFKCQTWNMPFLFDEVAKEIFFQDKVLFLEGQDDVGLINKYLEENNIDYNFNLFGYGVRGAGNFELALTLANDLGLTRVGCILDRGSDETRIYKKLKAAFGSVKPKYLLIQHSKKDIRDKLYCQGCKDDKCQTCKSHRVKKVGYFDVNGDIKPKDKIAFEKIITKVCDYFKK